MGDSGNVTRRALLEGAAAAGAASLIGPAAGLAATLAPGRELAPGQPPGPVQVLGPGRAVFSRWVGHLTAGSAPLRAPRRFSLVGVQWEGPAGARIELRARAPGGRWSPWALASVTGHDGDGAGGGRAAAAGRGGGLFGEPMWTGPADYVQVRADRPVAGLALHFVSAPAASATAGGARAASAPALARPALDAGPGQPPIIARGAWARGQAPPRHPAEYGTVKLAFVHHTVNPNGYGAAEVPAMLLAIYDYHVHVRGFWDIAYNFLVDLYGRIWEGRAGGIDLPVVGAQAGGYNRESTGAAVLGDFMNVAPSPAAVQALERLLAWKLSLHGVPTQGEVTVVVDPADYFYTPFPPGARVSLPRVAGHRQGDLTDCPGNAFFAELPRLRPRITALAGTPARLALTAPAGVVTAGTQITLSGRLTLLSGAPLAGAPIEVQRLERPGVATIRATIATATTAADGSWSAPLTLEVNAALRALHAPYPAAAAGVVSVPVAPVVTLAVVSTSPLRVAGTIAPAKPRVTLEIYRGAAARGRPLKRRIVRCVQGRFSATLSLPAPGSYVLVATHAADALNAAGASPPVPVTVG